MRPGLTTGMTPSQRTAAYRARDRAAGKCPGCKGALDRPSFCSTCAERFRARSAARYHELRNHRLCVDCKVLSGEHVRCRPCAREFNRVQALRAEAGLLTFQRRIAAGQCVDCKSTALVTKARCESCADAVNEQARARRRAA